VSDYIDELVREHFPCSPDGGCCDTDHDRDCRFYDAMRLARAVAERVMDRARVCGRCSGAGWYQDDDDKSNTLGIKCPRCVRGVTFGGEA
jgi:ribosomal protein S27AE